MSEPETGRARGRRGRRAGIAAASLFAVAIALLWTQREPIAEQIIRSELEKRGVPASYRLVAIGPGAATLRNIRLGPPEAPDLVAGITRVGLRWGWKGPVLESLSAQDVVLRGRWGDQGLSLGSLDRLMPAASGEPFTLPEIRLALSNVKVELGTPAGPMLLDLAGQGLLTDGFRGRVAVRAPRPRISDCAARAAAGTFAVSTGRREISVKGPVALTALRCSTHDDPRASVDMLRASVNLLVPERLETMRGGLRLAAADIAAGGAVAAAASYDGRVEGRLDGTVLTLEGKAALRKASIPQALRRELVAAGSGLDGTPLGPTARKAATALAAALAESDVEAAIEGRILGGSGSVTVKQPRVAARSGASLQGRDDMVITLAWPQGIRSVQGQAQIAGGGLPSMGLTLVDGERSGQWSAQISALSYMAPGAKLMTQPFFIGVDEQGWRVSGSVTMDGPLAGGHVEGLTLPVSIDGSKDSGFSAFSGRKCLNLGFRQLNVSGISFGPHQLPICRAGGPAVLALDARGRLSGGGTIDKPSLTGRMGDTPIALAAGRLALDLGGSTARPVIGLNLAAPTVRLGDQADATHARAERLALNFTGPNASGAISGVAGKLSGVPLLFDEGQAAIRITDGVLLAQSGAARVRDAAAPARFTPVRAQDFNLRFSGQQLTGDANIAHIGTEVALGRMTLAHDFGAAAGKAAFQMPQLAFGSAVQPENLTPLTLGIVANVIGAVTGHGEIRWNQAGVESDGVFSTDGIALAAAFGPVNGLKGEIRFSDLLGLETPPGQVVTLAEVNPGVAVENGVVSYQLLPGLQVQVEGGKWPFAGGELLLAPTLLDFSEPVERHFTFRVVGLDAARFVQQLEFDNFAASGLFDGILPMVFTIDGGRIVGGRLVARKPGGTLAYVGELSEADIGSAGKLAFDALKSMRYSALAVELDGALDGEIVSSIVFNGTNQAPVDLTGSPLAPKLTGMPFKFNIRVQAPFRGLLNTARSFTDVTATFRQASPNPAVQAPDSEETR